MKALRSRPSVAPPLSVARRRARARRDRRSGGAGSRSAARPGNPRRSRLRSHSNRQGPHRSRYTHRNGLAPSGRPCSWPVRRDRVRGPPIRSCGTSDVDSLDDGDDGDDADTSAESKLLKLFEVPLRNSRALSDFLRDLFGSSRSSGEHGPGGELRVGPIRRSGTRSAARADPDPLQRRRQAGRRTRRRRSPAPRVGCVQRAVPAELVSGRRVSGSRTADLGAAEVPRDEVLRRRLSRVGLGPKVLRRRPDGDELDIEALIELAIDLRSGYSPAEHVYPESRKLTRDLGVLILLDCSGSATDTDSDGLAVHEHQRRAAATLAAALTDLGDRVAVYGFRSHGRHAVHLLAVKTFSQRFGAMGRTRLHSSNPRVTRAWARASGVPVNSSRRTPAHRIACCSCSRTDSPTTTAMKVDMPKRTPRRPSRNSARTALPASACRSAPAPWHSTGLRILRPCERCDPGRAEPADGRSLRVIAA